MNGNQWPFIHAVYYMQQHLFSSELYAVLKPTNYSIQ